MTGSLKATLQRAISPVVANLNRDLGEDLQVWRSTPVKREDNSTRDVWAVILTMSGRIDVVSAAHAQRVWGMDTAATAEAVLSTLAVRVDDVVKVLTGGLTGRFYTVVDYDPDDVSLTSKLALVETDPVS